jgi:hypothetical protein
MADRSDSNDSSDNTEGTDNSSGARLSALELSRAARVTVAELTGYRPESVTAMDWDGDSKTWEITVDALELERIPNTTDLLGEYIVKLDEDGTLRGYHRTRRFQRGAADGDRS